MKNVKKILIAILIALNGVTLFSSKSHWQHKINITNQGTRSQGKVGKIYYKNINIGYYFHRILTPAGEFAFEWSRYTWGKRGYFKISNKTSNSIYPSIKMPQKKIKQIIQKGYFTGFSKYKNIPDNWIRVMRKGNFYWLNPGILEEFIKKQRYSSLLKEVYGFRNS